jgi:hypothetical protein
MPIKRMNIFSKRTCKNGANIEDLLRANSVIQHTKDDIIRDVKTILKKELKKEIEYDNTITIYMIYLSFITTNLNIFISTM